MTVDELDKIDGRLGITMPSEYRAFMLAPPKEFHESSYRDWIFDTAEAVILATERCRIEGFAERRFPFDCIVIGETEMGDFFCLDVSNDPPLVKIFDHESQRSKIVAFSFSSWILKLQRNGG
jgi:hypothetical protein